MQNADMRTTATSEATLWIIGSTATALIIAALLMLAMIARNAVPDASLGGFVSGVAIMTAALGVGALSYVTITAKREGYLGPADEPSPIATATAPRGMHIVPAVPADLGQRKRQELRDERAARSRQAKAIAAAAVATGTPRPAAPRVPTSQPTAPQRSAPHPAPVRLTPPVPNRVTMPAPPRVLPPAPVRVAPAVPAQAYRPPVVRMPHPRVQAPRPVAWPAGTPVVRMGAPRMHPHSQAALFQVNNAVVRTSVPDWLR